MTVNQISIFLENKYGKLSEILALLAEEKYGSLPQQSQTPLNMVFCVSL